MVWRPAIDDVRLSAGLYDIHKAARLVDLPEQTFHRWANVPDIGPDNLPESLRLHVAMPSHVVVDPRHMFCQPVFVNSGARMADLANMIKAGEDSETVAAEHGVTIEDVRTAARVLLGHAA